jgi:hypothetical protein
MNEAEWLGYIDPELMMIRFGGKASDRKFRLFAVACWHRIWSCLSDDRSRKAVEVSERYADGQASDQELLNAAVEASEAARMIENVFRKGGSDAMIVNAAVAVSQGIATGKAMGIGVDYPWGFFRTDDTALPAALAAAKFAAFAAAGRGKQFTQIKHQSERETQAMLIRCLFSNIYSPISLEPVWLSWNDAIIPKLAQAIYNDRVFDRLPILADALEEAGCNDADILNHCRQPGEHVRGCWVVDLILGKS